MALARIRTVALFGVGGHVVDVEAATTSGAPGLHLVGLPAAALSEVRDRVRAAIVNSGEDLPKRHVTISLYPASLPKKGSGFDLAIAIAILAADEAVPVDACAGMVLIGELGLDGRVRQVPGVLPAVLSAAEAGAETVVVANANAAEASLVPNMKVIGAGDLSELVARLRCRHPAASPTPQGSRTRRAAASRPGDPSAPEARLDLADIHGNADACRALEVSAAGGHSIALMGPPASGTTMLAECLPTLLPDLDPDASIEVTAIHSVAGKLSPDQPLITRPPFCAPHHTISRAALVGGGSSGGRLITPGVLSLAHRGVLFMDQATEFSGDALEALRQPIETGEVVISQDGAIAHFPARFTLVLAAEPCPCHTSSPRDCSCTLSTRQRHLARLSKPLLDIDIKHRLGETTQVQSRNNQGPAEPSRIVADRVQAARDRARRRLADLPWRTNAEIPSRELRRRFAPPSHALAVVEKLLTDGHLNARGLHRVIRLAWTLADLAGYDTPTAEQVRAAFELWNGLADPPLT